MEPSHSKLEQLNQSLKKALGSILLEVFPGENYIVTDVLLDPSYRTGRVWLNVPESKLKHVEEKRPEIQSLLDEHVKLRFTPKLTFLPNDHYLEKLDTLFEKVHQDDYES